jgi:hypothetical protein
MELSKLYALDFLRKSRDRKDDSVPDSPHTMVITATSDAPDDKPEEEARMLALASREEISQNELPDDVDDVDEEEAIELLTLAQEQVLLGIAWLGEVTVEHVRRLWLPRHTDWAAWKLLNTLHDAEYVQRRLWYQARGTKTPVRRGYLWSLTDKGCAEIVQHPQYPLKVLPPRSTRMIAHDKTTTDLIVRIVELGRKSGLSGLHIQREARIDPERAAPIMDALIAIRRGGGVVAENRVPWVNDPKLAGERVRRYAVENDRKTEQMSVIVNKAYTYQQVVASRWHERFGTFPIPLWIVPTQRRKNAIMQAWADVWPNGKWLIATDKEVQHDRWLMFFKGDIVERPLFE